MPQPNTNTIYCLLAYVYIIILLQNYYNFISASIQHTEFVLLNFGQINKHNFRNKLLLPCLHRDLSDQEIIRHLQQWKTDQGFSDTTKTT